MHAIDIPADKIQADDRVKIAGERRRAVSHWYRTIAAETRDCDARWIAELSEIHNEYQRGLLAEDLDNKNEFELSLS